MKTKTQYFVMLWNREHTRPTPLVTMEAGETALFDSEGEAEASAQANILGQAYGYDVFDVECAQ